MGYPAEQRLPTSLTGGEPAFCLPILPYQQLTPSTLQALAQSLALAHGQTHRSSHPQAEATRPAMAEPEAATHEARVAVAELEAASPEGPKPETAAPQRTRRPTAPTHPGAAAARHGYVPAPGWGSQTPLVL